MTSQLERSVNPDELQRQLLLRRVELQPVRGLLENCPLKALKKEEVLIHAGQENHFLYLLLSGSLRVHLNLDSEPVAVLEPGDFAGELSVIDGELTSAHVIADEDDSRVLVLDEDAMWSIVDASPVARNLLFVLSQRLRHTDSILLTTEQLKGEYEAHSLADALTGLYNRRWFKRMMPRLMERCRIGNQPLALLFVDVDNFRQFNASGYLEGDRVLHRIARILQDTTRPGELIIRYGGDEFLTVLPNVDIQTAGVVAERIRLSMAEADLSSPDREEPLGTSISVGVAEMTAQDTPESLFSAAEAALRESKSRGGNRVFVAARST